MQKNISFDVRSFLNHEMDSHPDSRTTISRSVSSFRTDKNPVVLNKPYGFFREFEWVNARQRRSISTLLITNRECPWRCTMCDLWKNTTDAPVGAPEIISQIQFGISKLPSSDWIKIYNSGSFFDLKAIPRDAWKPIAKMCHDYSHLIVENHPRLVSNKILEFQSYLKPSLEIAMGLETANEEILKKLNKGFTLTDFRKSCNFLRKANIKIRAFILIAPPWTQSHSQAVNDVISSCKFAEECGIDQISLIPTRGDSGFMKKLQLSGEFIPFHSELIEDAFDGAITSFTNRCHLDTWDLNKFFDCHSCKTERISRIERINQHQSISQRISCSDCRS